MTELLESRLVAQRVTRTRLTIRVSGGAGEGRTPLSAFDAALRAAGVENFNLVRLSSVIPPQAHVGRVEGGEQLRGDWGDRLYCVYAEQRATEPGEEAWAGIGWVFQAAAERGGLFVEHEGSSRAEVEWSIRSSLGDLTAGRPQAFGPVQMQLASARCVDRPVCAIVVASYETEAWRRTPRELDLASY
jgi:arginine decarboxylase